MFKYSIINNITTYNIFKIVKNYENKSWFYEKQIFVILFYPQINNLRD
jgi:hypothetical protein